MEESIIIKITKANKAKQNDLRKLIEMFKMINDIEDAEYPTIKQILMNIGDLSHSKNGLSENSLDANCIRNKYGYINRFVDEKNKINKTGIYFEKLYHLKEILYDSPTCLNDNGILSKLKNNLQNLQMKIAHILCVENELLTDDGEFIKQIKELNTSYDPNEHKMADIIDISSKRYDQIAIKKINEEIITFEDVDFSIRDDRYYFARKIIIIGKKLYEIIEDEIIRNADAELNTFKPLYKIEYGLINLHNQNSNYLPNEQVRQIRSNILEVKKLLSTIINIDENKKFSLNYHNLKLLSALCTELFKIRQTRRKQSQEDSVRINNVGITANTTNIPTVTDINKLLNKLKYSVINVYAHIQNPDKFKMRKNVESEYENTWKKLTQYLDHFPRTTNHLNNRIGYFNPKLLDEVESYNKNIKKLTGELEINYQTIIENIREELTLLPKTLSINENKETIIERGKYLKNEIIDKQDRKKRIESKLGRNIKTEYKNLKKLGHYKNENEIKEKMKACDKIMNISRLIDKEMKYLIEIEPRIKNKKNKEYYITEHIISLISIYCNNLKVIYEKSMNSDDQSIPSNMNPEYSLNFFKRDLSQKNENDISKFIYKVSLDRLIKIGSRFYILNWYNVAIKYFKQAIDCIPKEYCLPKMEIDQHAKNIDNHEISLNTCLSVTCSNLSHFYLLLVKLLIVCYIENNEFNKAFGLLEPVYEKVQSIKKMNLRPEYYEYVSDICFYNAKCFFDRHDYEKAGVLFKRSLELSDNLHRKMYVSINYTVKKKPDIVKELLSSILNNKELDPIKKFYVLKSYKCLLRQIIEDPNELIMETNKILLEINRLSEIYHNEFEDFQTRLDFYAWSEKLEIVCGEENQDDRRNSSVPLRKFEP